MTSWADLNKQELFKEKPDQPHVEIADTIETVVVEEAAYIDPFVVIATDGRHIPILLDHHTRSVYPVREKA